MQDVFNTPTQQKYNVQYFYRDSTWEKPRGVSQVYMLLIGGGGDGTGTTGGGSGAVTVWFGAAQHVPDNLNIVLNSGSGKRSTVKDGRTGSDLMIAYGGTTSTAGSAFTANEFAAVGFFKSTAGVNGSSGTVTASTTTFLSVGGSSAGTLTANYGYTTPAGSNRPGFFMTQPIIVGAGGMGSGQGGIGCGGGLNSGPGGPGLVIIASW